MLLYDRRMTTTTFGSELKQWRSQRRISQFDLSIEAGVSARHISFLESGRSNPSQEMVVHLAETLDVPKSDRNRLLTLAGYAARYTALDLTSDEMKPVREALTWTLHRHDPYPAFVLDRHWNIVENNRCSKTMFALMGQTTKPQNMIDLLSGDEGLRDCVTNWDEVSSYMLARLKTENVYVGGDPRLEEAIERFTELQGEHLTPGKKPTTPLISVDLDIGGMNLSFLSSLAQFGAADDYAVADLKLEFYFPADDTTRQFLHSLPIHDDPSKV